MNFERIVRRLSCNKRNANHGMNPCIAETGDRSLIPGPDKTAIGIDRSICSICTSTKQPAQAVMVNLRVSFAGIAATIVSSVVSATGVSFKAGAGIDIRAWAQRNPLNKTSWRIAARNRAFPLDLCWTRRPRTPSSIHDSESLKTRTAPLTIWLECAAGHYAGARKVCTIVSGNPAWHK